MDVFSGSSVPERQVGSTGEGKLWQNLNFIKNVMLSEAGNLAFSRT